MSTLEKITQVSGKAVHIPGDDIDTDRIIPARFMKCVTFDGLGEYLFHDVRFDENGKQKDHPLNRPENAGAKIIVSGSNFGCGSSREHAPQSIHKAGFRGIIAESFAEIFFGNCTTLGIPCVSPSHEDRLKLGRYVQEHPEAVVTIDLESRQVRAGDGLSIPVGVNESAREVLMNGRWDPIAQLLENMAAVKKTCASLPYTHWGKAS